MLVSVPGTTSSVCCRSLEPFCICSFLRFIIEFPDKHVPGVPDLLKYVLKTVHVDDFLRLAEQLLTRLLGDDATAGQMVKASLLRPIYNSPVHFNVVFGEAWGLVLHRSLFTCSFAVHISAWTEYYNILCITTQLLTSYDSCFLDVSFASSEDVLVCVFFTLFPQTDPVFSEPLTSLDLSSGKLSEVLRLYLLNLDDQPRAQCMSEVSIREREREKDGCHWSWHLS